MIAGDDFTTSGVEDDVHNNHHQHHDEDIATIRKHQCDSNSTDEALSSTSSTLPQPVVTATTRHHHQQSQFLSLPFEIRHQILTQIYKDTTQNTLTLHTYPKLTEWHLTQTSSLHASIHTGLLYVCRQLYSETLPVLLSQPRLIITFDPSLCTSPLVHRAAQPDLLASLPPIVIKNLRHVVYRFPYPDDPRVSASPRPCRPPFPFALVPALERFEVVKTLAAPRGLLIGDEAVRYKGLNKGEKLEVWKRRGLFGLMDPGVVLSTLGRFGCGGWLSQLCQPQVYGCVKTSTDPDNGGGSVAGDGSSRTSVDVSVNSTSRLEDDRGRIIDNEIDLNIDNDVFATTDLGVSRKCEVVITLEVILPVGDSDNNNNNSNDDNNNNESNDDEGVNKGDEVERLVVQVGVRDKKVLDCTLL